LEAGCKYTKLNGDGENNSAAEEAIDSSTQCINYTNIMENKCTGLLKFIPVRVLRFIFWKFINLFTGLFCKGSLFLGDIA
jgi:hypothetical protein